MSLNIFSGLGFIVNSGLSFCLGLGFESLESALLGLLVKLYAERKKVEAEFLILHNFIIYIHSGIIPVKDFNVSYDCAE